MYNSNTSTKNLRFFGGRTKSKGHQKLTADYERVVDFGVSVRAHYILKIGLY